MNIPIENSNPNLKNLFISHLLPFLLNCNSIIIKIITSLMKGVIIMENNDKKIDELFDLMKKIIKTIK